MQWLDQHPAVAIAVIVTIIIVAGIIASRSIGGSNYRAPIVDVYYYDLDTGELFTAANQTPPITSPSGGDGLLAAVYGCGVCDDPQLLRIAYLSTFKPAADTGVDPVQLISRDRGATWHPYGSPEGVAIIDNAEQRLDCLPDAEPVTCRPTSH